MDHIKEGQSVLHLNLINDENHLVDKLRQKNCSITEVTNIENLLKTDLQNDTFDVIYSHLSTQNFKQLSSDILKKLLTVLKPGGLFMINKLPEDASESALFELKTNGFINVVNKENGIECQKPNYEIGSSAKLNLPKKTVWKIDDEDAGDNETIDPDDLLDEDDLKKPDPSSLRVCNTTGKRKACKNCSCGLAEELAAEKTQGSVVDTSTGPKSSCGNCYLGDAFRCASCPYLGMPAFKPGEKIQLSDNQLKADI